MASAKGPTTMKSLQHLQRIAVSVLALAAPLLLCACPPDMNRQRPGRDLGPGGDQPRFLDGPGKDSSPVDRPGPMDKKTDSMICPRVSCPEGGLCLPETVHEPLDFPFDMVIIGDVLYLANSFNTAVNDSTVVQWKPLSGNIPDAAMTSIIKGRYPRVNSISIRNQVLYFQAWPETLNDIGQQRGLFLKPLGSDSGAAQKIVSDSGIKRVAVNDSTIYWATQQKIFRRKKVDAGMDEKDIAVEKGEILALSASDAGVFISAAYAHEAGYDHTSTIYYWANSQEKVDDKFTVDGISGEVYGLFNDNVYVYWVTTKGEVFKKNKNGSSGNDKIAQDQYVPPGPKRIVADDQHVYWTNEGTRTVNKAVINKKNNNTDLTPILLANSTGVPFAIAVDNCYVYWTINYEHNSDLGIDKGMGKILRVPKRLEP